MRNCGRRDGLTYGREAERVDFDTESCHVLLLEFTSQVAFDEGGLIIMISGQWQDLSKGGAIYAQAIVMDKV